MGGLLSSGMVHVHHTTRQQKALGMPPEYGNAMPKYVGATINNKLNENCVLVGFSRIFLLGILIFKGLTARRLYKSFSVKGLMH
jgi:hypothetical protein